jgi:5-methyltetrahydrofolate--homocysteine methyltransferase
MGLDENSMSASIHKAIFEYKKEDLIDIVKKSIEEKIDPLKIFNAMMLAIREIGDLFNSGELFLPDLIVASATMQSAIPLIEEEIDKTGAKAISKGTVAIGTVRGDVHSIGKNIVAALLRADGYRVIDLGVNVPAESFINSIESENAEILAMSALLTTTMREQGKVISAVKDRNLRSRVKIMVGGAPITELFAKEVGADGYASNGPGAVKLAKKLIDQLKTKE